jgi:hypothetical protein
VRAALVLGACAHERAHVLQPSGQRVALALELCQAQEARAAEALTGRVACGVGGDMREACRDEV